MNDETSRQQSSHPHVESGHGNELVTQGRSQLSGKPKLQPQMSYQQILRKLAAMLLMMGMIFYLVWAME